jgi:DNA-directed RNA polymerase sigma subunit (sigma70/sigma32)
MSKRENPVDHVLDRMVEAVLGENAHFKSHSEALGIPAETIKTWRRRGEVPPGKLADFARDWKVSVDWLLFGPDGQLLLGDDKLHLEAHGREARQKLAQDALADDERKLLENYRKLPSEVKETLQLVASIASRPVLATRAAKPPRVAVSSGHLPDRQFVKPQAQKNSRASNSGMKKRGNEA